VTTKLVIFSARVKIILQGRPAKANCSRESRA
jgi:hypothetical protein